MEGCSEEEAIKNITSILGTNNYRMKPVGNHSLGRHLVYRVEYPHGNPMIYKQYCKKNRRVREVIALEKLFESEVPCPQIESYGTTDLGIEWLMLNFLEGDMLDSQWEVLNSRQKESCFHQMGKILSLIHSVETYNYFGYWTRKNSVFPKSIDYYTEFCRRNEVVWCHLQKQTLPDFPLLKKAVEKINEQAEEVKEIKEARLVHQDYDGRNILVSTKAEPVSITGILDFEQSCAGNAEIDLADVYARYFLHSKTYEKSFLRGYQEHLPIDPGFFQRLPLYILHKGITICSWSYQQAPLYYREGIEMIKQMLNR
ncbi:Fructosamine-3-kinase [Tindallia magadiensis]|uniref:Fructosamine-3-kinase n=1 Tax=Tindallia magadiensis TaxID=69895 RepID=A0A1I3BXX7_9FIRM|nr:phosphotransferase [Tindallia magadiensis]SFH66916.1 Fructosamine-3-kinase [Tindallia magadiensis]